MNRTALFQRYAVPGFVIRSVLVGATYSTGREIAEFFLKFGPFPALIGLMLTTLIYSVACIVAFELARRYRVLDYKSFCQVYMGQLWFLYELGFIFGVMLTLSTIAAASGEFGGSDSLAKQLTTGAVMIGIAGLVWLGSDRLERIMSIWSIFFYSAYGVLLAFALLRFGPDLSARVHVGPVHADAVASAAIYAGFNCSVLPIVIFVARHFRTRSDTVIAGALAGPMVMLPGLALLLMLIPFSPGVVDAPIPILLVLGRLDMPWLAIIIKIAILGELVLNGAGLLHGVNERIAKGMEDRGRPMPKMLRPIISAAAIIFSVVLAVEFGLIELVAAGFRYGAYLFLIVMVLPLLTRGLWMVLPRGR